MVVNLRRLRAFNGNIHIWVTIMARLKRVFLYFSIGLLLYWFTWQKFIAFSQTHETETFLAANTGIAYSAPAVYYQLHDINIPIESVLTTDECEVPNENEQEEDFDSGCDLLADEEAPVHLFYSFITSVNYYPQSQSSVHTNISVPLFILYHSWKGYMS